MFEQVWEEEEVGLVPVSFMPACTPHCKKTKNEGKQVWDDREGMTTSLVETPTCTSHQNKGKDTKAQEEEADMLASVTSISEERKGCR